MAQGIGLAGGFGAGGARDALVDLIAQRMAQEKFDEQKRARSVDEANALAALTMREREATAGQEMDRARLAENRRQFGETLGLDVKRHGESVRQFDTGMGFKREESTREQGNTERGFGLKERQLTEEERANRVGEGIARGRAATPREERIVQIMGPNGTPIWVRESEAVGRPAAQAARAVTGSERQALAYYNRAKEAVDTLTNPGSMKRSLEERIAGQSTVGQLQGQYAPNILQNREQQAYRQAQRAFTEARLRKESGAAIPAGEYENDARTYFAQPGDSPQVIEQKRKARQTVLDGLRFASGKAYDEFYGDEAPGGGSITVTDPRRSGGGQQFDFDPKSGKLVPRR